MKSLLLILSFALIRLFPLVAAPLSGPSNLRVGLTAVYTYNQGVVQLLWTPGTGSKFIAVARWVRPGTPALLTPVDGRSYGTSPSTNDLSTGSYVGSGNYVFLRGNIDRSGSSMIGNLRNLSIGHDYQVRIYEYDSIPGTGPVYTPASATLSFVAPRFLPVLAGSLNPANVPTLTWTIQAHYRSLGFQMEYSTDGIYFNKMGTPPTLPDSSISSISITEQLNSPITVPTYYRLRATYMAINEQYSNVILLRPPVALPVELVHFTGELLSSGLAQLSWRTASERNAAFFEVQRSTDGRRFTGAGRQAAAGTSSSLRDYQLIDPVAVHGTIYYRLWQVDKDSSNRYTLPIRIVAPAAAFSISCFPNPVLLDTQTPILRCSGVSGELLMIEVFDLAGRRALQHQVRVSTAIAEIPLALPVEIGSGLYLVKAVTSAGHNWQGRLTLTH